MKRETTLAPLYGNCSDCRHRPTYQTRQRQFGRAFQPVWRTACATHVPKSDRFHEIVKMEGAR